LILDARQELAAWLAKWGARDAKLCHLVEDHVAEALLQSILLICPWVEEHIEETLSFDRCPANTTSISRPPPYWSG